MKTITVGELIAELQAYDTDMPVVVAAPAGDYWRTTLALTVDEVYAGLAEYSEYHRKHVLLDDEANKPDMIGVLVLG